MANETQNENFVEDITRNRKALEPSIKSYAAHFLQVTNTYLMEDSPLTAAQKDKIKAIRAQAIDKADKVENLSMEDLKKWNDRFHRNYFKFAKNFIKDVDSETMQEMEAQVPNKEV